MSEPVLLLVDALIDGFFTVYGDSPAAEVLDDLDLSRDTLVEYAVGGAPRLFDAVKRSGELERIVREQLEPFYSHPRLRRSSAEVVTYQPVNAFDAFCDPGRLLEPPLVMTQPMGARFADHRGLIEMPALMVLFDDLGGIPFSFADRSSSSLQARLSVSVGPRPG